MCRCVGNNSLFSPFCCLTLLSYQPASILCLIHLAFTTNTRSLSSVLQQFTTIFTGLGCMKDKAIKLHIDDTVTPVALPHGRIPFHIRAKVEEELRKLEAADIIERATGPTPCFSPIVVAPKRKQPREERICVEMRLPNNAFL